MITLFPTFVTHSILNFFLFLCLLLKLAQTVLPTFVFHTIQSLFLYLSFSHPHILQSLYPSFSLTDTLSLIHTHTHAHTLTLSLLLWFTRSGKSTFQNDTSLKKFFPHTFRFRQNFQIYQLSVFWVFLTVLVRLDGKNGDLRFKGPRVISWKQLFDLCLWSSLSCSLYDLKTTWHKALSYHRQLLSYYALLGAAHIDLWLSP